MNLEELQNRLEDIAQMDGVGLNVYFLLKSNSGDSLLKRANLIEDVKENLFAAYKEQLMNLVSDDEISLINLSSADDRAKAVYLYDLENTPQVFSYFDQISNSTSQEPIDYFSFDDDNLSDLEGYFVHFGDDQNNLIMYRKQMPINLFKRGKIYLVKGHDTQFEAIDKEFLRIDSKIDLFKLDGSVFVNNISILERHYEFKDIIEAEATASLGRIEGLSILENIQVLEERVSDISFARKLSKISTTSPVFTLPAPHIMEFVHNHAILSTEFRYNDTDDKILLDTKKSQNFFLKLMNDDFLHSELTDYDYLTPAKDRLQVES